MSWASRRYLFSYNKNLTPGRYGVHPNMFILFFYFFVLRSFLCGFSSFFGFLLCLIEQSESPESGLSRDIFKFFIIFSISKMSKWSTIKSFGIFLGVFLGFLDFLALSVFFLGAFSSALDES